MQFGLIKEFSLHTSTCNIIGILVNVVITHYIYWQNVISDAVFYNTVYTSSCIFVHVSD
jgi:hypothetical protein